MRTSDLNVADLDTLVEALTDAGVRSVSFDPAQVNLPGVWINVNGFSANLLAGLTIRCELVVMAPNYAPKQALAAIAPVFNVVMATIAQRPFGGPTGDPTTGVWQFANGERRPGVSIPLDLLTTQEIVP